MTLKTKIFIISAVILMGACVLPMYISWDLARKEAERKEVARKGVELVAAINSLARKIEPLGANSAWPKTEVPSDRKFTHREHISDKAFTNAESYFEFLLDGTRIGQADWRPFVDGIDYSHLAGAGVPIKRGGGKLSGENTMWCILADFNFCYQYNLPVLVTRNVDVDVLEAAIRRGVHPDDKTPVTLGRDFSTPFGDRVAVVVTAGGKVLMLDGKNLTVGACFDNKKFSIPPGCPDGPRVRYLKPSK
jgi:hypothetical protein